MDRETLVVFGAGGVGAGVAYLQSGKPFAGAILLALGVGLVIAAQVMRRGGR